MQLVTMRADTVKQQAVSWLWDRRIPLGKVTMLAGDPGLGKSFFTSQIAAWTTTTKFPDGATSLRKPGDVVFMSAEDDPNDTIRPRLEKHGADLSRVHIVDGVQRRDGKRVGLDLDQHLDALEQCVRSLERPRLIVIDPISAYLGQVDGNSNAQVRGLLRGLSDIAQRYGPSVLCVSHLSKGNAQMGKAVYRVMGSLAFVAAARVAYYLCEHPDDTTVRCLSVAKANLDVSRAIMSFKISDGRIAWKSMDEPISMRDLEGAGNGGQNGGQHGGPNGRQDASRSQRPALEFDRAREFLEECLPMGASASAGALFAAAEEEGLSERSLRRARASMGIVSRKVGEGWVWTRAGLLGALESEGPADLLDQMRNAPQHDGSDAQAERAS